MGMAKKISTRRVSAAPEHPLDKYINGLSEHEKSLLSRRAKKLAQSSKVEKNVENIEALCFILSGEKYAIETKYIAETLKLSSFTPLPTAPAFLLGVMNLRGEIISIINLKEFFELSGEKLSDLSRVIVLKLNELMFGVLADKVEEVMNFDNNCLTNEISTIKGIREEYMLGVSEDGVIILNGGKILSDNKLIIDS